MQVVPLFSGTPSQSNDAAPIDSTSPRPHQFFKDCRGRQQRLARAQDVFRQAAAQRLGDRGGILFIDEIGKAQQLGLRVVEGDVEVAGIHQLTDDVVNGGEKLLQILGGLAARGNGVQGGIQFLGALLLGDVAIGGVGAHGLAVHRDRRGGEENLNQGAVFPLAAGLQLQLVLRLDGLRRSTRFPHSDREAR